MVFKLKVQLNEFFHVISFHNLVSANNIQFQIIIKVYTTISKSNVLIVYFQPIKV